MGLEPLALGFLLAPLGVMPPVKPAGREARAIKGKLRFNNAKRCRAPFDKIRDDWSQVRVGNIAVHRIERRRYVYVALLLGVSYVAIETPGRETGVNLHCPRVYHVSQG